MTNPMAVTVDSPIVPAEDVTRWHAAKDAGSPFPAQEQTELEALVEAELAGATGRAAAMVRELRS